MNKVIKEFTTVSAIRSAYSNGELSAVETVDVLATAKLQKPWHTKEWRTQREKILAKSCTQCSSQKKPLVLQHTWHPSKLSHLVKEVKQNHSDVKSNEETIYAEALNIAFQEHDRYLSCKDTTTYCRKCAFLYDQKKKKMCQKCKKYIPINVDESSCFNCFEDEFGTGAWLDEVYRIYDGKKTNKGL